MSLREISAALQRGERLTSEQKARTICALKGWTLSSCFDGGFWRAIVTVGRGMYSYEYQRDGDPFECDTTVFRLVRDVFPTETFAVTVVPRQDGTELCHGAVADYFAIAPTPSAAIMAAAIEAFLAKGGV